MGDLYIGIAVVASLSGGVFVLMLWISHRLTRSTLDGLALLIVLGIFVYIRCLWYQTRLLNFLPFSNLVVLGNWFPIAAAALAGLAWNRVPGRIWRKSFSVAALSGAAMYTSVWPLTGVAPRCENVWTQDGICLQTTSRTCTPACAATLLRHHGIAATEQEMAELCLTRTGTTWQGLYRGLKRKTANTSWDVEVLECNSSYLSQAAGSPLILSVGLPQDAANQQAVVTEWGWRPGIGHSVLFLSKTRYGRFTIADPTPGIGCEEWTKDDLQLLFRGMAMRLVKR